MKWFSYDLEKLFRQVFVICFISQWMKRSKHGLFVFPPKKTLIWRRHCSIGQSCCIITSGRSIDWFLVLGREVFSPERSLNQPKATRVFIRSMNQSNRSISVRLLFLFCSRVFISRWYENRSIERFRMSQVPAQNFQSGENSSSAMWTQPEYDFERSKILIWDFCFGRLHKQIMEIGGAKLKTQQVSSNPRNRLSSHSQIGGTQRLFSVKHLFGKANNA